MLESFCPDQRGDGIQIEPFAEKAAADILEILAQLSINDPKEIQSLQIPVVSAYVKGMQAHSPDTENIDYETLKEQVYYVIARAVANAFEFQETSINYSDRHIKNCRW